MLLALHAEVVLVDLCSILQTLISLLLILLYVSVLDAQVSAFISTIVFGHHIVNVFNRPRRLRFEHMANICQISYDIIIPIAFSLFQKFELELGILRFFHFFQFLS